VIELERMYPIVVGANLGTTMTGLLAALAADPQRLHVTLQVAYTHLLFNVFGIAIFYVPKPLRRIPIKAARRLGDATAQYRWVAIVYIVSCFLLIPLLAMLLSLAGPVPLSLLLSLIVAAAVAAAVLAMFQKHRPEALPLRLRSWDFLPPWLSSLEWYDRVLFAPLFTGSCSMRAFKSKVCHCRFCCKQKRRALVSDDSASSPAAGVGAGAGAM